MKRQFFAALISSFFITFSAVGAAAFGFPGITPNWASAKNVQVGTSLELKTSNSPLWFTNAEGALREVFFPTIDTGQIKDAKFLISDGKTFFVEEKKQTKHKVKVLSSSLVELTNTDHLDRDKMASWESTKKKKNPIVKVT
jgi:glucoamylase